jgi:phosphate/sulfate permease
MKVAALFQRILPPVWLGMICAIAMEAQLKFQAPNVTREIGLGIGKLVFTALNQVECVMAILLLIAFFVSAAAKKTQIIFAAILLILLAQTFWLIPNLIERIDLITGGQTPPNSSTHLIYIAFEVCKMILLLALSIFVNWRSVNSQR